MVDSANIGVVLVNGGGESARWCSCSGGGADWSIQFSF